MEGVILLFVLFVLIMGLWWVGVFDDLLYYFFSDLIDVVDNLFEKLKNRKKGEEK